MSGQRAQEEAKAKTGNNNQGQDKTASPRLSATAMAFNPTTVKANPFTPTQRPSSAPSQAPPSQPAGFTAGQVPPCQAHRFTPGHLTPGQHHQLAAGHQQSLIPASGPLFGHYSPGLSVPAPNFYPAQSPSYPSVPTPPADENPNYNLQGREIAPGLTVGYAAISPETMLEWVKGKSYAAAITIIDGRVPDTEPILGNSTNALKHQAQPWETPQPNFLSLVIRKSNLALMYKLKEICDFIDRHYATPPSLAEQREAARGFDKGDDGIFLGPELLGLKGKDVEDYHARHMRPAKVVMIHGGQTDETRYQPTFIGLAYLMRKWRLGLKQTIDRATRFDRKWHGERLSLSDLQIEGLEVWDKIQYDIWNRAGKEETELKPIYVEYIKKYNPGEEKRTRQDSRASV